VQEILRRNAALLLGIPDKPIELIARFASPLESIKEFGILAAHGGLLGSRVDVIAQMRTSPGVVSKFQIGSREAEVCRRELRIKPQALPIARDSLVRLPVPHRTLALFPETPRRRQDIRPCGGWARRIRLDRRERLAASRKKEEAQG